MDGQTDIRTDRRTDGEFRIVYPTHVADEFLPDSLAMEGKTGGIGRRIGGQDMREARLRLNTNRKVFYRAAWNR